MARALKVYRTPIGFHDAYVAAPSQKAALAAWGADANLFARGVAEEVTDAKLTADPLARPGEVIRKLRGTADEHLAALPAAKKAKRGAAAKPAAAKPAPAPRPRPSRDDLDAAEAALAEAERQHRAAERDLTAREAALARERRALATAHDRETRKLEAARDTAAKEYDLAVKNWRK